MIRALALCLAAVLAACPLRAQPAVAPGPLVITEIHFAPSPASNEFVEILNRSDAPVDLQTVTLADGNLRPDPLADRPTLLSGGDRVVVVRDPAAFEAIYPDVSYLAPPGWDALNNGGDLVLLRQNGAVLDSVVYASSWSTTDGASLERIDPAAPSDAFNFASSTDPTGATPGRQNSVFAPDRTPPMLQFAEVMEAGTVELVFSEPIAAGSVPGLRVTVDGVPAATVRRQAPAVLAVEPPGSERPRSVTVAGARDRSGNRAPPQTADIARSAVSGDVAITEIMAAPRADDFDNRPNQVEYLEVVNRSNDLLSLRGWSLTDRPREDGTADTLAVGRRIGLPPGGRAVVFAAPTDPADPATGSLLAEAFPTAPLASIDVALLPVDRSALGLRNREDVVRLLRADGALLEAVAYTEDWHVDALTDPTGTALERISAEAPASLSDNWTSSPHPDGGTPGAPNGVSIEASRPAPAGVTVTPSPFSPVRDRGTRIRYTLDARVSVLRATIYDARGRRVRSLAEARLTGSTGELVWDGRGDDGRDLRVGIYVVLVDAVDADGGIIERHKAPVVLARRLN